MLVTPRRNKGLFFSSPMMVSLSHNTLTVWGGRGGGSNFGLIFLGSPEFCLFVCLFFNAKAGPAGEKWETMNFLVSYSQNASGKNMLYYAYLVAAQPLPARRQALLTVKHHLIKHQLLPVIDFTMAFQLPQRKNTSSGFPTVTRSGSCSVVATGYKHLNRLSKKLQCGFNL